MNWTWVSWLSLCHEFHGKRVISLRWVSVFVTLYLLDLTGKSKHKACPYQLYQAFSILYWQPPESPLWCEVEELWEKQHEDHVVRSLVFSWRKAPNLWPLTPRNLCFIWQSCIGKSTPWLPTNSMFSICGLTGSRSQRICHCGHRKPMSMAMFTLLKIHISRGTPSDSTCKMCVDQSHKTAALIISRQRCRLRWKRLSG